MTRLKSDELRKETGMAFRYSEKDKKNPYTLLGFINKGVVYLFLALLLAVAPSSRLSWAAAGDPGDGDVNLQAAEKALRAAEKERDDLIQKLEEAKREKEEAFRQAQESLCKRLSPYDCKTIGENFAKIILYTATGYSLVQIGPILGMTFLVQMLAVTEVLDDLAIKPEETAELERAKLEVTNKKVELKEIEVKLSTAEKTIQKLKSCAENEWAVQQVSNLSTQSGEPGKSTTNPLKLTLPKDQYVETKESIPFSVGISGGTPPYTLRIYSMAPDFKEINTTLNAGQDGYDTSFSFSKPGPYSVQVNVDDGAISGKQLESGSVVFFVLEPEKPASSDQLISLKIEPGLKTLKQGEKQRFEAYGTFGNDPDTPVNISEKVTWYPSPDFTAKEAGISKVSISYKGKTASVSITVVAKEKAPTAPGSVELLSLGIDPPSRTLQQGDTQRFEAYGVFSDNPNDRVLLSDKVTWYTSPDFSAKDIGVFNVGISYKGKSANVSITVVKKDGQDPGPNSSGTNPAGLRAALDCGDSFELAPGDFAGKGCGIIVRGWRGNTGDRVEVKVDYDRGSGIEIFPGDTSAPPSLMYTAGVSDYNNRYIFSQSFRARNNAPTGTTTITFTISQKGAGQVVLTLSVAVLPKDQLPSSGSGIRPPAQVATGSGGTYCVWRYKMFGDPAPCFHFVAAVCGKYSLPDYELVGQGMTWGEADARVGQLSRYFQDQYGCTAAVFPPNCTYSYSGWSECQPSGTQTRTVVSSTPPGCKGTPVLSQSCVYTPPPPPPCTYEYSDWTECELDNLQSRTVVSKKPEGCKGTPILLRACTYKPPPPVLTRFGVFCSPSQIDQKGAATCKATGEYSNAIGTYIDLTARASWTNGPTFEGKGKKGGSYTVTASLEGASSAATVTVVKGPDSGSGYDPTKDPGLPGGGKSVDPNTIKGPLVGFQGGSSSGTRPPKPEQPESPTTQPTDYTKPPEKPGRRPPSGGDPTKPGTPAPPTKPTKPGIEVTTVGTAPPGKCTIVTGQLVAVKGYKENISGMTVVLTGPTSKSTSSSGGGAFSFSELPAGKYVLSVKQWNYGMTKADFVCESGKAVKVVMKGSCPYLYVWNGTSYEKENDIYPVARLLPQDLLDKESRLLAEHQKTALFLFTPNHITEEVIREKAMTDYYRISRSPRPDSEGNFRFKIVEQATEHSYTDRVQLMSVEHRPGTQIGITREGRPFLYKEMQPLSYGNPSRSLYNGDTLEITLPAQAFNQGMIRITWQGFLEGTEEGRSGAKSRPHLALQRKDPRGQWQTVDWVYPRDEVQESFFLLNELGDGWDRDKTIRLMAASCEPHKYHRLDQVAWGSVLAELPRATYLDLLSARKGTGEDTLEALQHQDGKALFLGPGEEATLLFKEKPSNSDGERSFFFISHGLYIPMPLIRIAER